MPSNAGVWWRGRILEISGIVSSLEYGASANSRVLISFARALPIDSEPELLRIVDKVPGEQEDITLKGA